jgi:hypothetical protein
MVDLDDYPMEFNPELEETITRVRASQLLEQQTVYV